MNKLCLIIVACCFTLLPEGKSQSFQNAFVEAINELRGRGCNCSGERFKAVGRVYYDETLSESAYEHARDIRYQRRLNHYSSKGQDIGERISDVGYNWKTVGENLAFGHESIDEVIDAWIDSYTHCKLLMDPRFDDVGFAKIGPYWVLHFGEEK